MEDSDLNYPSISWRDWGKSQKASVSQSPSQYLKLRPSQYEKEEPISAPQYLVGMTCNGMTFIPNCIHISHICSSKLSKGSTTFITLWKFGWELCSYLACLSAFSKLCGMMSRNCRIFSQVLGSFGTLFPPSTLCMRAIMWATSGNTSLSLHEVVSRITPGTYSYAKPLQNVAYSRGA